MYFGDFSRCPKSLEVQLNRNPVYKYVAQWIRFSFSDSFSLGRNCLNDSCHAIYNSTITFNVTFQATCNANSLREKTFSPAGKGSIDIQDIQFCICHTVDHIQLSDSSSVAQKCLNNLLYVIYNATVTC